MCSRFGTCYEAMSLGYEHVRYSICIRLSWFTNAEGTDMEGTLYLLWITCNDEDAASFKPGFGPIQGLRYHATLFHRHHHDRKHGCRKCFG